MNRQWRLAARPVGPVKDSDFEWREEPVPEPAEGQVLVRNVYLSLDPAARGWIRDAPSYMPVVGLGDVMRGIAIGVVEASRHPGFSEGDLVRGMLGWQDYLLSDGRGLTRESRLPGVPLTAHLAVFGHIGLTAYVGVVDIGRPKPGKTMVVTAAAGAVGSLAGQIGKIHGCRVVGIAGSDEKCRWLTQELGFDGAINYKTEQVGEALVRLCPNGIDIDFENVGGEILDAILARINRRARIVVCGLISQYNATAPVPGPYQFARVLIQRARVEGFIVLDHLDRAPAAMADLGRWLAEGKLRYRADVVEGLENAPRALGRLFDGSHQGKLIIQVSAL